MEFVFDNTVTVIFAVVMSFWGKHINMYFIKRAQYAIIPATIFVQLWKREQALLQIRWNVTRVEKDTTTR